VNVKSPRLGGEGLGEDGRQNYFKIFCFSRLSHRSGRAILLPRLAQRGEGRGEESLPSSVPFCQLPIGVEFQMMPGIF